MVHNESEMKKTFKQWAKQDKDLNVFLCPGHYFKSISGEFTQEEIYGFERIDQNAKRKMKY